MHNYEKLGAFFLGKQYDLANRQQREDLVLYDAKDLTTHAVCVGMTGSGKTGLCLALLEEAAIDGVPAICIDPKGDLGNLMLTFPDLSPGDFRPWIEEAAAARKGQTPEQYAATTAKLWRQGLASWDQPPERIARLKSAAESVIYTPASNAGIPITVLKSFAAPPPAVLEDEDSFRERITSAASGLLALLGIDADPVRSREHILVSNILDRSWRNGKSLDVPRLIQAIQKPPFERVGVFDLESFYPADDRLDLAMQLNNLLASPSFASWMEGEPLDIQRLLYTPEGKSRLAIVSIAHLSEAERMFFVTILLNEVLAWIRTQPGTSSLRAILYMDEIYGYFPPTAMPPSKRPMLTLLKQARAYGLGVVLATQNPVDLDYKGLSNTGTWFLGRLQTERDKMRVLEGLEGASTQAGTAFDRKKMEATLAGLGSRVFLMNNVHDDEPVVFHTRWVMSYLRGPLTRSQIETLMEPLKSKRFGDTPAPAPELPPELTFDELTPSSPATTSQAGAEADKSTVSRPVIPPEVEERFVRLRQVPPRDSRLVYRPALLGEGRLHYSRTTYKIDTWQTRRVLSEVVGELPDDVWDASQLLGDDTLELEERVEPGVTFAPLPVDLSNSKTYARLEKELKSYFYRAQPLHVFRCPLLKAYSQAGESQRDFRAHLAVKLREQRDLAVEKLRKSYASKLATLQDRIRSAEARVAKETSQYRKAQLDTAVSFGSSILGALLGRKLMSRTNVSKASTSMRSFGRAADQRGDISHAEEKLEAYREQLAELAQQFETDVDNMEDKYRPESLAIETLTVRPTRSDISVGPATLVWTPWFVDQAGIATRGYEVRGD